MVAPAPAAAAGRPRDVTIERRVMEEAIRQFGERGWGGFSIDKISSAVGVGKASIYLRWDSKEDLILAAIEQLGPKASDADTGSLAGDLRVMIADLLSLYTSDIGLGVQRLNIDVHVPEALTDRLVGFRTAQVRSWRRVIRRAIGRGDLANDTSIAFLLNVVHGATWSYATTGTPAPRERRAASDDEGFVSELVGLVLKSFT